MTATYSHLNGLEFLLVHKPALWNEIQEIIASVDAESCRTKVSKERRSKGELLYAPIALNRALCEGFMIHDWTERRASYWVTADGRLIRKTMQMPPDQ